MNAYTFSQSTGTYTEVGGGATTHLSGAVDDGKAEGLSIGFGFVYNGSTVTQFSVCANGHLALAATMDCTYNRLPISNAAASNNNLAALGFDLKGLATGSVSSEVTGASPNRVLTVQWKDFAAYYSGTSTESYNFQIKLHEGSNQIDFVYGSFLKNSTARTPQVGIRGASNADFRNRTTTTDWSASTAGTTNTATMALSTSVLPSSGLTFTFTPPNFPPAITYTALGNTLSTADRSLTGVAITDGDGVNTTPGTAPRLYFKRSGDANTWNDNTSATDGWKYVEANGATSPFDFTINYALLNGGSGVSAGQTVQYFVVAQDLAATPLVGINNGSFAAAPASVALDASAFPIGGSINSYRISELMSGTYQVPGSYPSLTNAGGLFEALNGNVLSGNVVIEIAGDLTAETGAIALNQAGEQPAGSNFTITIRPTGAARVISGTSATSTGLIVLNGTDRVTIDGSLSGGSDQSLTITNLATDGVVIWVHSTAAGNGATDNTFKNCIINGAGTTVAGILSSGSTFGGDAEAANSNNMIRNNLIAKVQNALYLRGGPTTLDAGWLIEGNTFGSTTVADKLSYRGMLIGNAQDFVIADNVIMGVTTASTSTASGIQVALAVAGGEIWRNRISDIKNTNATGYGSNGIYLAATSTASNLTVANNFVSDVASMGYAAGAGAVDNGYGIMVASGGGYNLYYNSVLLATNQTNGGLPAAINIAAAVATGSLDLRNNIFATTQTTGTRYAIYSGATNAVFSTINHNDYFPGTGSVGFLGAARATLGDWQTASGQDANSIAADPLFVSTTDLHISAASSPVVDAGTPIATVISDIDGGVRSATTPDIGADEVNVTAPVVTSSVGTGSGQISPLGSFSVTAGGLLGFDVTPDPGFQIDNIGGSCPGTLVGNYFTAGPIMGDCNVVANFKAITWTVTPSVGTPSGTISPSNPQTVSNGGTASFTLTADAGYEIDNVGGSCTGTLTGNSYTTNAITGDCTVVANFKPAPTGTDHVRISQVYGGGGGGAGYYLYDYVELFNPGTSAVSLAGYSLQYGSATGQFGSSATNIYAFPAATSIAPGKYLLVQLSSAGSSGLALPVTADLTTTNLTMSGTSGKVALANVVTALGCGATTTPCALPHANIVDLAAYGTSNNAEGGAAINNGTALTNQQGGVRKGAGCQDTDNNNADFDVLSGAALVPRNSAAPANTCGGPVTHTVTPSVGTPSGSISPSAAQTVNDGDTTTFTLTADAGYEIDNVGGDCGGTLDSGTGVYTTNAITADCSVVANFKPAGGGSDIVCNAFNHAVMQTSNGTYINWETGAWSDTATLAGAHFNPYGSANLTFYWPSPTANAGVTQGGTFAVLALGATIGPASTFARSGAPTAWRAGADGYLGFSFACSTAPTCYGYMHFTTTSASGYPATMGDYCWNKAGNAITVAVPGPFPTVTPSVGSGSGTISPSTPQSVNVGGTKTFTLSPAAGFHALSVTGTCGGTLTGNSFTTNPVTASCTVVANFEANPSAAITPASLSFTAIQGASDSSSINIANVGGGTLTYSVAESATHLPTIPAAANSPAVLSRDGKVSPAVAPRANPQPLAVVINEGFEDVPGLLSGGWIAANHSSPVGASSWSQCGGTAIPPAYDGDPNSCALVNFNSTTGAGTISNWLLTSEITFNPGSTASFYTRTATGAGYADRLEVRVCASGDCTNFGTGATDVGNYTTLLLTINPSLQSGPDPTGVNGYPDTWTQFTLTGLPTSGTGRIAFRYFVTSGGPSGDNSNIIGIDRLVVDNGTASGCALPTDIPWLSVNPAAGSVAAGANEDVTVSADAASLAAGTYTANVCVATNDAAHAMTTVPVSFTVTASTTPPTVSKSFTPDTVFVNQSSVATITLSNSAATPAVLTAPLVDALPGGLSVSGATTTCLLGVGGSRPAPMASVTLPAGATIPANGSCTVDITVSTSTPGSYVNTIAAGALQTDQGNNAAAATATLTVNAYPPPLATFTPTSFAFTVQADQTATDTLNIANAAGHDPLTFSIDSRAAMLPRARASALTARATAPRVNLQPVSLAAGGRSGGSRHAAAHRHGDHAQWG
ncbi:MAG: choice-of-anchor J domain-containing protein [Dokdonella sp.]|uniref:choice-of-anchor J domain-containing protein n=1 Tax=Dokdonella sp. TaxID=2291710 RepID=UPI0025B7BB9D|nr:choice-of-anchor J domain-containing protein [Dokdonella sp.]MBX3700788.1 choice-of-anchor J domain-containing protein [Dokdonella sp.]